MPVKQEIFENPIELAEAHFLSSDHPVKRVGKNEVIVSLSGRYCEYQALLSWDEQRELLHISFGFSVGLGKKAPAVSFEVAIYKLLALLNENLYLGHFELWREEYGIVWRHAQYLYKPYLDENFFNRVLREGQEICEQNFPAFQYVIWGGKSPEIAVEAVLFETEGTA